MKKTFSLMSVLLGVSTSMQADRLILEDFADAGTWRQSSSQNATPGTWFAADHCLSGVPESSREDGFAGKLIFDFKDAKPGRLEFLRAKTAQTEVFADAVTFDADTAGLPCRLGVVLQDLNGKKFATSLLDIGGQGWKSYRLELNAKTIKDFKKIAFPVKLMRLVFSTSHAGKGSIMIDDLAFTGAVSKKRKLNIFPITARLDNPPDQPFNIAYRLANAAPQPVSGKLTIVVKDFQDRTVHSGELPVAIPAQGRKTVTASLPSLPIGAYYAELKLNAGGFNTSYTDWFNVFTANNGRLNRHKMWFGIQDTDIWNGEYERRLHGEWLKLLGADLVRFGMTGGRMESGETDGFAATARFLDNLQKNDLLICLSYCENSPAYVRSKNDHRSIPDKMPEFQSHLRKIFTFLKKYPNVRYFEWWNEPDIGFLNSSFSEYLASLKTLYTVAKSIAPNILITTGGVTVIHPKEKKNFSRDMYQQGKGFYDIACFHAHGSLSNYVTRNEKVEEWLKAAKVDVPLCNTETGERSSYNVDTIKRQAEVLVKKITYAKSRNTDFYIWFTIQDYWDMDFEADDSFGLVTSDNRAKPSFAAYNELIRQLANTDRGEKITVVKGVDTYRFVNPAAGEEVLVCWPAVSGVRSSFALTGTGNVKVSDMFGRAQTIDATGGLVLVPVDATPCYVRYPRNAFKPAPAPIVQDGLAAGSAGNTAVIRLKLRNTFGTDAVFELVAGTTEKVKTALAAGKEEVATLTVPIPAQQKNGIISLVLKAVITAGPQRIDQQLPISVNVCYPVVRQNMKPENIVIDNLAQVNELSFDPAIPKWRGPQDLSASLNAVSDGKNLLFAVDVTDDRHILTNNPENAWRDDSLQMGFANLNGGHTDLTISGKDGKGTVWCHLSIKPDLAGAWKVPVAVNHVNGRTQYRFSLPLANLGIEAKAGTVFRFAFLVNENDGQGRVRWIEWNSGIGRSKNPDEFGWGVLK